MNIFAVNYLRTNLVDIKEQSILFCMWGYSPHTPGNCHPDTGAARCIAFFAKRKLGVIAFRNVQVSTKFVRY